MTRAELIARIEEHFQCAQGYQGAYLTLGDTYPEDIRGSHLYTTFSAYTTSEDPVAEQKLCAWLWTQLEPVAVSGPTKLLFWRYPDKAVLHYEKRRSQAIVFVRTRIIVPGVQLHGLAEGEQVPRLLSDVRAA